MSATHSLDSMKQEYEEVLMLGGGVGIRGMGRDRVEVRVLASRDRVCHSKEERCKRRPCQGKAVFTIGAGPSIGCV